MTNIKTMQAEIVTNLLEGSTFEYPAYMVAIDEMVDSVESTGLFKLNRYEDEGIAFVEAVAVYETYILCHEVDGVFSVDVSRKNLLDNWADHAEVVYKTYKTERGARKFAEAQAAIHNIEWDGFFYGENEG